MQQVVIQLQTGLLENICITAFPTTKLGELKNTLQLEGEHFLNWPSKGITVTGAEEARL